MSNLADLSEIIRTAWPAAAILSGTHAGITLARAYIRYRITENEHPGKEFLERLPRCFARRVFDLDTFGYTLLVGALAVTAYYLIAYSKNF